jgi:hypothetical protein
MERLPEMQPSESTVHIELVPRQSQRPLYALVKAVKDHLSLSSEQALEIARRLVRGERTHLDGPSMSAAEGLAAATWRHGVATYIYDPVTKQRLMRRSVLAAERKEMLWNLSVLDEMRVTYRLAPPEEAVEWFDWLTSHFPVADYGRIDWSKVPNHYSEYTLPEDTTNTLTVLLGRIGVGISDQVVRGISSDLGPGLEIDLKSFVEVSPRMLSLILDTWVIDTNDDWCIEVHAGTRISVGRS